MLSLTPTTHTQSNRIIACLTYDSCSSSAERLNLAPGMHPSFSQIIAVLLTLSHLKPEQEQGTVQF